MIKPNLIETHSKIIYAIANKYYWRLPAHVHASFDFEDMVSELTLHLLRRQKQFKKQRGASSTFVWTLLERHCWSMLKQQTWAKRATEGMLSFDAQQPGEPSAIPAQFLAKPDAGKNLRESRIAVETMIRFASGELREALSDLLTMRRQNYQRYVHKAVSMEKAQAATELEFYKWVAKEQRQLRLQIEVGKLAKLHSVTIEDFRTVLAGLV